MRKLLASLAVLVALLVLADFGTAAYAEYRVSRELRDQLALAADPDVRINGFPFLTQAVRGEYGSVQVQANGVPVPDLGTVSLTAVLHGVRLPLGDVARGEVTDIVADEVDASVRIGATTLGRYLRIPDLRVREPLRAVSSGTEAPRRAVVLTGTVSLLGVQQELSVEAGLSMVDGAVVITATGLDLAADGGPGTFTESVLNALLSRFTVTLDPAAVPFGITPTGVRADGSDIVVEGSGTDVTVVGGPTGR